MDDTMHVVHPRAAGLDIHKMAITATIRMARPGGVAVSETREFPALSSGLAAMTGWLLEKKVDAALMEGTGIYWEAPADPEAQGPQDRCRTQKATCRAGIRIGGILTDIFGSNGRRILDGLVRGDDRQVILDSLSWHVRRKLEDLGDALSMSLGEAGRLVLADLLEEFDSLTRREQQLTAAIRSGLAPWHDLIGLLTTIPGISEASACAIFAEIGPDIDAPPSADHLAAWAGPVSGQQ